MSSQAGFVTNDGRLSAKALKRIFKDGVAPNKSAKKRKVAKAEHIEVPEEKIDEIPAPEPTKPLEEEARKKRCLDEAAEMYLDSCATAKELLMALAEATKVARNMKILEEFTAKGVERPEFTPFSGEAWERSNITHMIRKQRYGKDNDGERTPPISLLIGAHTSERDMADLVTAPEPADMSSASPLARFASQASDPIHGLETVDLTTGDAHGVPQPAPGHEIRHDQAPTHLSPYSPTPLTSASQARFTSQVADPIHGLTAVVPTTGGVIHALHPDPGHEIRHD
jgi:hypothetical protein